MLGLLDACDKYTEMGSKFLVIRALCGLAMATVLAGCGGAGSSVSPPFMPPGGPPAPVTHALRIGTDPFSNNNSQHATTVEPHAFAWGNAIVAAFQTGRFSTSGSSDIGFSASRDGGNTWSSGALPGTTHYSQPAGIFDSISDPVVAYDAAHAVWLISAIPVLFNNPPSPAALVSRSTDGTTWSNPITVAPNQLQPDKDWIVCDNSTSSPFFGRCYLEWDEFGNGLTIHMSTSSDGGLTWSAPQNTTGNGAGIGGQPLVGPQGRVVVPIDDPNEASILAYVSNDGGATWTQPVLVSRISDHQDAGGVRSGPLPSAAIDAGGTVYLVWQDCRFETACSANDLVLSTSRDGILWSTPARIPLDALGSGVDHFIPGIGTAAGTSGSAAKLGLTYYYFPSANCSAATCQLYVGSASSSDGGTSWTAPTPLAGPMSLTWLPQTNLGAMVGDYIATVFAASRPLGVFAVANPPAGTFDEGMYVPQPGVARAPGAVRASAGERPIAGLRSDHALYHPKPIQ